MSGAEQLKRHLKAGKVCRRQDLAKWSKSVDRHLVSLLQDGTLKKLYHGLYYYPKKTAFGNAPPEDDDLIANFLNDDRFLITSPNAYNGLGVGTTQLYNTRVVYNHKRHGQYKLGNRKFEFRIKTHFPKKITDEFLLVDLVNNLNSLVEDHREVLTRVLGKARKMDKARLRKSVEDYGNMKARKIFSLAFNQ